MVEWKRSSQSGDSAENDASAQSLLATDDISIKFEIVQNSQKSNDQNGPESSSKQESFSFWRQPAESKLLLVTIAFCNFAVCACFSLLAPFFPAEAAKKGASQTIIGLIFSSFQMWVFISSPIYGNYLTRIGSRFLFLSGLFFSGSCSVLFGVLDKCPPGAIFIVMCFLVRTVEALGSSAFMTASFAIIANTFPNHVSTVFGTLETFSGIGMMVGPPIGGALYELGGYGLPFFVIGGMLLTVAAFTMWLLPNKPDNPRPDRDSMLKLCKSPLVLITALSIVGGAYSVGFLDPTLSDHLAQFDLRTVYIGLIFILPSTLYALTAPLWGYISNKKGLSIPLVIVGDCLLVIAYLLIGPSPLLPFLKQELWLVIVSLSLAGLGLGCSVLCALKCLLDGAKSVGFEDNLDTYGLVSGLYNSTYSLGTFIGPTFGSLLLEYSNFEWSSTATAGIQAFAAIAFIVYVMLSRCCNMCQCQSHSSSSQRDESSDRLLESDHNVSYSSLAKTTLTGNTSFSVSPAPDNV